MATNAGMQNQYCMFPIIEANRFVAFVIFWTNYNFQVILKGSPQVKCDDNLAKW